MAESRSALHERAARTHDLAAECHEFAAAFWARRGYRVLADIARRTAEAERVAAGRERERACAAAANGPLA